MFAQYFYFSTGVILWVSALFIFIRKTERAFYFLAGHLVIMGLGIITRSLIATGQIEEYPHVYQVIYPLHFLYGPLYFYFLITFFRPRYQFKFRDTIHLLPFLINLIDYLPFYVTSSEFKRIMIQTNAEVSAFGISVEYYNLCKSISFIFYFLITGWFYLHFVYNTRFSYLGMTRFIHYWLRTDYLLKMVAMLSGIYLGFITKKNAYSVSFYFISIDSFMNLFVILRYPHLLKGIRVEYDQAARVRPPSLLVTLKHFISRLRRAGVDKYVLADRLKYSFDVQQIFLDDQMNEERLSLKLNLNLKQLEAFIQDTYGCSCEDYIQYKRHEYLSRKISTDEEWNSLPFFKTIFMAGFDSATSLQATLMRYDAIASLNMFSFDREGLVRIHTKLSDILSEKK
jgi:hypothetical protein